MAEVDNTKQFQAIGSWQVGVDASSNASARLVLDKTPGISLKTLVNSLDIDEDATFGQFTLNGTTHSIIPSTPFSLPNLLNNVTVDGVTATADGSGAGSLILDSVRDAEQVTADDYTGSVSLTDKDLGGGTGKKLLVKFPLSEKTENLQEVVFSQITAVPTSPGLGSGAQDTDIIPVFSGTGDRFVNSDYTSMYDEATGEFVIGAGQEGYYGAEANIIINRNGVTAQVLHFFGLKVDRSGLLTYTFANADIATTGDLMGGTTILPPMYLEEGDKISPYYRFSKEPATMFVHQLALTFYRIRGV